jgi:hypothetical protein
MKLLPELVGIIWYFVFHEREGKIFWLLSTTLLRIVNRQKSIHLIYNILYILF